MRVLGDECDCLIYFNNTNPASKYGGSWEELPQGTFLQATGTNGTISSGTRTDGGSNTHTNTIEEMVSHAHKQTSYYGGDVVGPVDWTPMNYQTKHDTYSVITSSETTLEGSGKPYDIRPQYKNCHIWRRIS